LITQWAAAKDAHQADTRAREKGFPQKDTEPEIRRKPQVDILLNVEKNKQI
jgi:hypothetical protein